MANYPMGLSRDEVELKTMFQMMESERGEYENRWEDYSGWTLPGLFTLYDASNNREFQHDYQALGAQAVNHLANKIVMTLFAPARPFFRLDLTKEMRAALVKGGVADAEVETLTAAVEREAMRNMERVQLRTAVIMAIKNLITLGNTLIYFPEDAHTGTQNAQVYNLRDYCVDRDCSGIVTKIVMRDQRVVSTLPPAEYTTALANGYKEDDKIEIFTGVIRKGGSNRFFVKQELCSIGVVEGSFGDYHEKELPWIPLTWNLVRGELYGIGLVEEYAGDFHVYSQLSESVLNLAAIASDIKILVNPMANIDIDALNDSESGSYVYGRDEDITYMQVEKMQDFSFVQAVMDGYARRIGSGFLLNSQVTRDAERVTAEEIRLQANELESSLGGVYSRLAEDLQQPLARMLVKSVDSELSRIDPVILTGVESLSRNSEHEQMMLFLNDLTLMNNIPESMQRELKLDEMARILATNRGLEHPKFMKTDAEKKAEQERAAQMAERAEFGQSAAAAAGAAAGGPPQTL